MSSFHSFQRIREYLSGPEFRNSFSVLQNCIILVIFPDNEFRFSHPPLISAHPSFGNIVDILFVPIFAPPAAVEGSQIPVAPERSTIKVSRAKEHHCVDANDERCGAYPDPKIVLHRSEILRDAFIVKLHGNDSSLLLHKM